MIPNDLISRRSRLASRPPRGEGAAKLGFRARHELRIAERPAIGAQRREAGVVGAGGEEIGEARRDGEDCGNVDQSVSESA